jgi:AcrR family transcriptional regulator
MASQIPSPTDDPKSQRILRGAAKVFSDKGYHNASMRDIAAETGISLAGMYYYFASKEEMLFSIQRFCFQAVLDGLRRRVGELEDPVERLRAFIQNHLSFFIDNVREMKVLSHESDSLTGEARREIAGMKRDYFRALAEILVDVPGHDWSDQEVRRVGLAIFGMVNWIYTWYDPERDGTAEELAATMCDVVTRGILASSR